MILHITEADFTNPLHAEAIPFLINAYASDPMGGGGELPKEVLDGMVEGLSSHPSCFVVLAFDGERPVGIANCFVGFSTFAARPLVNVHDLAVIPEYRGRRVGERLLEEVEKKANDLGCCKLTLEVREDNRARHLYQRFGFGDFTTNGEQVQTFFLEKKLARGEK